jgi:hypothetical protein
MEETTGTRAHYSLPSLIAIGAVIASFFVSPGLGFVLAIVAIIFGVIGILLSLSPSVRGGFVSILSLIAGAIGVVVATIRAII